MNSMSRVYNECCEEKRRVEEENCPIIIKCGCPSSVPISTTTDRPTITTIAAVTVDKSCLCDSVTKLDFATNISTVNEGFMGTLSFRIFRQCNNQSIPVAVGSTWSRVIMAAGSMMVSFFICYLDSCENDCCTYTVVLTATATNAGVVTVSNASLAATVTCNNSCNKCVK
ncbi:MAG: DUF4489 domain-containing protein [Clostridium sp.]|uniref:DUF4489 domain-containing protein n=1 Tax=Clostridium sp. TaxID=1506 RepID=UPI0025C2BC9D|nr:DUF4489 domain-containing protein [Clostridium sp.]MCF0149129.1 DUF4489 domain-containing protein [Clostridium sp.]